MYNHFHFKFKYTGLYQSRLGLIETPNGFIETPGFFFCGTKGTIKGLTMDQLYQLNVPALLCNAYHLYVQPGKEIIREVGGLHKFIGWNRPIFTDSGGYQIFSMGYGNVSSEIKKKRTMNTSLLKKITDEGVVFTSYLNGKHIYLTPDEAILFQVLCQADIIVQFDECTPYHYSYKETSRALDRTIKWGDQSLASFQNYSRLYHTKQALYAVLQGGIHQHLREKSLRYVLDRPFFGIAIGGSLGKNFEEMLYVVKYVMQFLKTQHRPIHLLGIGRIKDILRLVPLGIDTFDCVYPTRLSRHGSAIVKGIPDSKINLRRSLYSIDFNTLDPSSPFLKETRAYIHHLLKSKEMAAVSLLTYHNMYQMLRLMGEIRENLYLSPNEWKRFVLSWDPTAYSEEISFSKESSNYISMLLE